MLVDCHKCEAVVDAREIAQHDSYDQEDPATFEVHLLECPRCKSTLVAGQYEFEEGRASRLWPAPRKPTSFSIPSGARRTLWEAEKCYRAGAFLACAVMCGRSLEEICKHFNVKSRYLHGGLKELRQRNIIDARLFDWSEALKAARNAAAHATSETISREDARDLLDLVTAICEYVFVLSEKFDEFMKRRNETANPADQADS